MKYDTAGNKIIEPMANCNCGLTGGCKKCNPLLLIRTTLSERLTNPRWGKEELDKQLREQAKNAPGIERVHEVTEKLPSFTKILLEDRR